MNKYFSLAAGQRVRQNGAPSLFSVVEPKR